MNESINHSTAFYISSDMRIYFFPFTLYFELTIQQYLVKLNVHLNQKGV